MAKLFAVYALLENGEQNPRAVKRFETLLEAEQYVAEKAFATPDIRLIAAEAPKSASKAKASAELDRFDLLRAYISEQLDGCNVPRKSKIECWFAELGDEGMTQRIAEHVAYCQAKAVN